MSPRATPEYPSVKETFGASPTLMRALEYARFKSVVPVMMMPREALMDTLDIKARTARRVTSYLNAQGLNHHEYCERQRDFIDEQFGCIEDAPIAALHVITITDEIGPRPYYAPIRLLLFMEEMEPHMVIRDLIGMTAQNIRDMIDRPMMPGPISERMSEDIGEISWRLSWWDPKLVITDTQKRAHLRVVGE